MARMRHIGPHVPAPCAAHANLFELIIPLKHHLFLVAGTGPIPLESTI